jgi:hypothetical protein
MPDKRAMKNYIKPDRDLLRPNIAPPAEVAASVRLFVSSLCLREDCSATFKRMLAASQTAQAKIKVNLNLFNPSIKNQTKIRPFQTKNCDATGGRPQGPLPSPAAKFLLALLGARVFTFV